MPASANSLTLRWSRPPTGPLPDKYLILSSGSVAATIPGTATTYRQAGLTPATTYKYRLVAERAGKRSPASALLTLNTITPPLSRARLQGLWKISARYARASNFIFRHPGRSTALSWYFNPFCATGACDVTVDDQARVRPVRMKLTRVGAVYHGQTVTNAFPCGPAGNSIPNPVTLKVRLRVAAAAGMNQVWAATSLAGTMTGTSQYVSNASYYCNAGSFTITLRGKPA